MTSVKPQPILVQPNQFLLGGHDTEITFSTTSFTGVPRLTYKDRSRTLNFSGEEIRIERTQLGQMVTVNLSSNSQAFGTVETLTLLIPSISVPIETKTGPIQTIAIFSLRSPMVKIPGQSQTYMTLCLAGTAEQVDF